MNTKHTMAKTQNLLHILRKAVFRRQISLIETPELLKINSKMEIIHPFLILVWGS